MGVELILPKPESQHLDRRPLPAALISTTHQGIQIRNLEDGNFKEDKGKFSAVFLSKFHLELDSFWEG